MAANPRPKREGFRVTYEIVTPESAEHGDAEDRGWIYEEGVSLREALSECHDGGYVEADCCPVSAEHPPSWFTFYDYREDYRTGERESRSLHIPDHVTTASRLRIARLVGCYGLKREGN